MWRFFKKINKTAIVLKIKKEKSYFLLLTTVIFTYIFSLFLVSIYVYFDIAHPFIAHTLIMH